MASAAIIASPMLSASVSKITVSLFQRDTIFIFIILFELPPVKAAIGLVLHLPFLVNQIVQLQIFKIGNEHNAKLLCLDETAVPVR